ncbi:MAG: PAS domain S-box protein [Methylococcaceae bacterium]
MTIIIAGLLASSIGLITLIGWLLDIEPLKRIHPNFPLMYPDTALAFVLSGFSLGGIHARYPRIARTCAGVVLLLAVLPVIVDVTGSGLYLSLWRFMGDQTGSGTNVAGHMSAMSSMVFVLAGLGLVSVGLGRAFPPAQIAALGMLGIAAFALVGYAYDVPWIHASARTMAVHTAFAAIALGIGLLFVEPGRGFAAVILSELSGGLLLRRTLPYVIAIPFVVGWLRLRGEYAGWYGMNTGLALFALSNIIFLVILLYRNAQLLNRQDLILLETERLSSKIVGNVMEGIITANDQGIIENFNAAASRIFGYAPEDVIGKNVSMLMPEPYRSEHDDRIRNYLRTGAGRIIRQGQRSELPAQRCDGSVFSVEIALSEIFLTEKQHFVALVHDITRRKLVLEQLRASEKRMRAIFDAEPECVKIVNADGSLLDINPAGLAMLEADSLEQAIALNCDTLITPRYREAFRAFLLSASQGDTASLQFEMTGFKGTPRWLDAVAVTLSLDETKAQTLLVVARDLTARHLAEQSLCVSEGRYRRVFESNMLGIGYWDANGGILDANDKLLEIIGYSREDVLTGKLDWIAITPPEYRQADQKALEAILETGVCDPFEKEYICKNGRRAHILIGAASFENSHDNGVFFILDITARKFAEAQLRKLTLAIEHSPTAIVITDINANIEYVNPKFYQLTGYTPEEVLGRTPKILQSGLTPPETYQALWETILSGQEWHGEFHDRKKNGQIYWCLQSISPVKNEHGEITHFVSVTEDISERKHSESVIRHLAFYDPLTDLPNRTLFRDRLEQAIILAERNGNSFALMYLDLDRFKNVNDTLGHPMGDCLLKAVAERMRQGLRDSDTVARLGGDEFAVIVQDMSISEDVMRLAEHLLKTLATPFFIEEHELFTSFSIGISIYPQDAVDIDFLIKAADVALYRAKESGRNNCQFFTSDMNAMALEHLTIENQLQHALERKELLLHYQPQIKLNDGTICGVEALVRWQHPERGMVSPETFIPIAEDSGLIAPIGEWVLREACITNKAWLDAGLPEMVIAVNVSAKQLRHKDFLDTVSKVLDETGLPPHLLEIELTESCVMQNPEQAIAILEALKVMGIKLSMDDFGTGYSSLAYLKRLPFNKIKIDRSFVIDVATDADSSAIASTIIAMTHSMHRIVIAEGVETLEQLDFLRAGGCDEIQGYYFSRPLEATALVRFAKEQG